MTINRKEYMKEYYKKNKEIINKKHRKWQKENPEKYKKISKICQKNWIKRNPEKVKKYNKRWRIKNKDNISINAKIRHKKKQDLKKEQIKNAHLYVSDYLAYLREKEK